MKDWLLELCGGNFMPHGQCYLWRPSLVWLHGVSDGLIALAYFSIPVALVYFVRRRRDLPFPSLFLMFGAFIVACGSTHALEVWTIWNGNYYVSGLVKALTAIISVATAVVLFRVMPSALQLTGPVELQRLNEGLEERVRLRTTDLEAINMRLRDEVGQRLQAEAEVNRLNQLLRRRVEELESLLKMLPVGVGIARDASCKDIRVNDALAAMLAADPEGNASLGPGNEALADKVCVKQEGRRLALEELPMRRSAAENRAVVGQELTVEHVDGRELELLCNALPLRDAEGRATGCIATFQDVTLLKSALRASARHAAIVSSSEDAVVGSTLGGIVTDWNRAAEKIFGYEAKEIIGRPLGCLIPEERCDEEESRLAGMTTGAAPTPFETQRLRKDGSLVDVSVMISPIRDTAGKVVGYSKVARDITERRREERQRSQLDRKIQETQKLESLGVLAGGIAHDFNNLLTGILGNASLAAMSLPPSSPAAPFLRDIEKASCRAAELCAQMLAYACKGRFAAQALDVNTLIEETTHLLGISIGKTSVLRLNLSAGLPRVVADASQIRQIVMNLVINASEAIGPRSGVIAITTGVVRADADYLATVRHASEMSPGDYVFVEVSDSGCGMDGPTLERIFEPFFTTKFTGRGLGLAAVLGIVRGHKGGLKVYSEVNRGTTFKLLLPAREGGAAATAAGEAKPAAPQVFRGRGRVLVVDDEETVRVVAARMLEHLGFEVDMVADGREAVARFALDPSRYTLVVLDLTMPHLNGEETYRQMRHIRPGVRVVLMSGFNEQDATTGFTGKGLAGYVQKPFSSERFAEVVRDACLG